jgi:hypothetical protein
VILPGLPLQWWNKRALTEIANGLGRFLAVDEEALHAGDKCLCRVLVEIEIHVGLPEVIELEWRGLILNTDTRFSRYSVQVHPVQTDGSPPSRLSRNRLR